jgi:hypothetical protein
MHPTVIIRVALPKNNLAKPQHIGGACVKWIPPFIKNSTAIIVFPGIASGRYIQMQSILAGWLFPKLQLGNLLSEAPVSCTTQETLSPFDYLFSSQ